MKCPECGSTDLREEGEDELGAMTYECEDCLHQFYEGEADYE